VFDPSRPEEPPRVVFHEPDTTIFDMNVSFDAETIFFSARRKGVSGGWQIYEIGVDGRNLKQITKDASDNISPCPLPDGRIMFVSTRRGHWVICAPRRAGLLFVCNRDGTGVRQVSANIDSDHTPQVMDDGRVLFTRWDYGVEKNVFARHALWTMNPDGTGLRLFFNMSYDNLVERDLVNYHNVFGLDHDENTPKALGSLISRICDYIDTDEHSGHTIPLEDRQRVYTWIDANVPYYATYVYSRGETVGSRDAWRMGANMKGAKWTGQVRETFQRRCMSCHERRVYNPSLYGGPATVSSKIWTYRGITAHGFPWRWPTAIRSGSGCTTCTASGPPTRTCWSSPSDAPGSAT